MTNAGGFWDVNFGNLLTIALLMLSFWAAHITNVRRIQKSAAEWQEMKTKLSIIYEWFAHNVVGRGEPPRHAGAGASVVSNAESGDD